MNNNLKLILKFNPEEVFYKAWFYKNWAEKSKNKKVKLKLIKKAFKEIKNTDNDRIKRMIDLSFKRREEYPVHDYF